MKELLEYQEIQKESLKLRDSFREETNINYTHGNRMPYVAYIEWLEHKLLTK